MTMPELCPSKVRAAAVKWNIMRRPLHIFFDLNHWIYLSRDYHGRVQQKTHSGIASYVLGKVQSDEVRIPLGNVHFLEHLQNENPARRERLAEVFDLYSRGWYFGSWSDICDFEVREALNHVFEGSGPARPAVFGRGFMFTTSAAGREILSEDRTRQFLAFFDTLSAQPGALFDLLTTTIETNRKQQKASTATLSAENASSAEDLRLRRRQCSREEYRRAQYATYTLEHQKVLVQQLELMHLSIQDFLALGEKGLSRFWSDVPSIDADCELTAYRDRQWSRKVEQNDVRDLAQLAIALPYCDAVVVERFWKRAITDTGLDQKYGTSAFCDLAELRAYLESEHEPKW
jgi:hypothetical protein